MFASNFEGKGDRLKNDCVNIKSLFGIDDHLKDDHFLLRVLLMMMVMMMLMLMLMLMLILMLMLMMMLTMLLMPMREKGVSSAKPALVTVTCLMTTMVVMITQ